MLLIGINFNGGYGSVVVVGIYTGAMICGKLTGAHFNMGVTVGIYIINGKYKKELKWLITMLTAQIVGGYLGCLYAFLFLGDNTGVIRPGGMDYSLWYVFIVELIFTGFLTTSVFHVGFPETHMHNDMVVGVLSATGQIYFSIACTAGETGAVLNPTVGFVNTTFIALVLDLGNNSNMKYLPAWFFGPLLGSIIAGFHFKYFAITCFPQPKKEELLTHDECYITHLQLPLTHHESEDGSE